MVGSVCRIKRFTTESRNVASVSLMTEVETEVRKWLRQQSKDFYAPGLDALVKRWEKSINVGGSGTDWVGPTAGMDAVDTRKTPCPCREWNPGRPFVALQGKINCKLRQCFPIFSHMLTSSTLSRWKLSTENDDY
jgi:hypothetical protein